MNPRPSLAELRGRVFKHSGTDRAEIGNWLARRVGRPSAIYGTWLVSRTRLSADAVTLSSLAMNLAGAVAIGSGLRVGFVAGTVCLIVGYWLDHVDGQVARWRGSSSLSGIYFDYLLHHVTAMTLGFALGFGLAMRGEGLFWAPAGFVVALGWTVLSLNNDCRYKAMFARLKRETRSFRVELQGRDRPSPPPPWPKCWPSVATWPMGKSCEGHVVLMALCILALVATVSPVLWLVSWKLAVGMMTMIAPTLAIGRAGKSILRREPDREFDRFFRPTGRG